MQQLSLWEKCLDTLQDEFSAQQFNTWIRPLQIEDAPGSLRLLAPNQFVLDWVKEHFLDHITQAVEQHADEHLHATEVTFGIGSKNGTPETIEKKSVASSPSPLPSAGVFQSTANETPKSHAVYNSRLNPNFTFETFVEGKSNQLALAAAQQVVENPGASYNPFFLHGGVGLGKTHLMHAVGNAVLAAKPTARVLYLHSERFVADMIKALQTNTIQEFKAYYRGVDLLMIDDVQFFAGKERSQEEFFHTFNALHEAQQQVILTSDRYPKDITGLEERLRSRLGWGLTVAVEPPELETRVAILMTKAEQMGVNLPNAEAFFIAKHIRSNVRELEGALRRVSANAQFTGREITSDLVRESLKDLLAIQERLVSIDNIQKTVAEYYKVKISDLLSKRRNRSITRPRQMAMHIAKELTEHSLPEIGNAFGGRDHTTVLHACRQIKQLKESDRSIEEDYENLSRLLST